MALNPFFEVQFLVGRCDVKSHGQRWNQWVEQGPWPVLTSSPGIHCDVQKLFTPLVWLRFNLFSTHSFHWRESPTNRLEDQWPACPSSLRLWSGALVAPPAFFLELVLRTRAPWECRSRAFDGHEQSTAGVSSEGGFIWRRCLLSLRQHCPQDGPARRCRGCAASSTGGNSFAAYVVLNSLPILVGIVSFWFSQLGHVGGSVPSPLFYFGVKRGSASDSGTKPVGEAIDHFEREGNVSTLRHDFVFFRRLTVRPKLSQAFEKPLRRFWKSSSLWATRAALSANKTSLRRTWLNLVFDLSWKVCHQSESGEKCQHLLF